MYSLFVHLFVNQNLNLFWVEMYLMLELNNYQYLTSFFFLLINIFYHYILSILFLILPANYMTFSYLMNFLNYLHLKVIFLHLIDIHIHFDLYLILLVQKVFDFLIQVLYSNLIEMIQNYYQMVLI
jgi:hypothetical protein